MQQILEIDVTMVPEGLTRELRLTPLGGFVAGAKIHVESHLMKQPRALVISMLALALLGCKGGRDSGEPAVSPPKTSAPEPSDRKKPEARPCAPVKLIELGQRVRIAVDDGHIYWADETAGEIARMPRSGGVKQRLAFQQTGASKLVLTDQHVHWTRSAPDQLIRMPKSGGEAQALVKGHVDAYAVDAEHLYWSDGKQLLRAKLDGSGRKALAKMPEWSINTILLDGHHVYWTSPETGQVLRVPGAGGGAPMVLAKGEEQPSGLVVDAHNLYWLTLAGVGYRPKAGGKASALAETDSEPVTNSIALGPSRVYWSGGENIWWVPRAGGKASLLLSKQDYPWDLAIRGNHAYWSTTKSIVHLDLTTCR